MLGTLQLVPAAGLERCHVCLAPCPAHLSAPSRSASDSYRQRLPSVPRSLSGAVLSLSLGAPDSFRVSVAGFVSTAAICLFHQHRRCRGKRSCLSGKHGTSRIAYERRYRERLKHTLLRNSAQSDIVETGEQTSSGTSEQPEESIPPSDSETPDDKPWKAKAVELPEISDEERDLVIDIIMGDIKANSVEQGHPVVERNRPGTDEEKEKLEDEARALLASDGINSAGMPVRVIELEEVGMREDPEEKYQSEKKLMIDNFKRGDIHLTETACLSLLDRKPDDDDAWTYLTQSRLRLKLWDAALEGVKNWIRFDPGSVSARNAEAVALAGVGRYGEARARFSQLAKEVESMDADMAATLRECVWRIDELWVRPEPEVCTLSARPATVITGARPPHFYLPDFADSIGPVKVEKVDFEEPGGGHSHRRKLVVTDDVEAGEPLFVQNPLAFAVISQDKHSDRLADALTNAATSSPHAAALIDLLVDSTSDDLDDDVMQKLSDPTYCRPAGTWSKDATSMKDHLEKCKKVAERSRIDTGRSYAGIWTLPSFARHSCIPSANYVCFGDSLIARAARDLKEGDEVTFSMWETLMPLELRHGVATQSCGGMWCNCARCQAESNFGLRLNAIAQVMQLAFKSNFDRTQAVKESLMYAVESRKKELEKEAAERNAEDERIRRQNLMGLADKFRDLNGTKLTDSDIANVKEFLPEIDESSMVKVPKDLADMLFNAVITFEEELLAEDLPEEHVHYFIASHFMFYSDALVLVRLRKDLEKQHRLIQRLIPAVEHVAPGSFEHQRLVVFNWEVAAQMADPTISPGIHELAQKEKNVARQALNIRYGNDLNPMEQEAAMARTSCARDKDENWFWEVSWCIGFASDEVKV